MHYILSHFGEKVKTFWYSGGNLKEKYANFGNIHLLDPIYESHEINWIRSNASLYVHGHSAGGTNPSLVEAMNFGLPILAFDCVYNRATTQDECLYWSTEEDIIDLVNNSESKFGAIARKMKELGSKEYAWEKIAKKYPNKIAVSDSNTSLTYEELNNKANTLAREIFVK